MIRSSLFTSIRMHNTTKYCAIALAPLRLNAMPFFSGPNHFRGTDCDKKKYLFRSLFKFLRIDGCEMQKTKPAMRSVHWQQNYLFNLNCQFICAISVCAKFFSRLALRCGKSWEKKFTEHQTKCKICFATNAAMIESIETNSFAGKTAFGTSTHTIYNRHERRKREKAQPARCR